MKIYKFSNFTLLVIIILIFIKGNIVSASFPERNKIVLLTSLKNENVGFLKLKELHGELSKIFNDSWKGSNFEIIIKHYSNQHDLWSYLQSSSVVALFWLSHGNGNQVGKMTGMNSADGFYDVAGSNVSNVFQNINENYKWLSVIDCNSLQTISRFYKSGYYNNHKNLKISSYPGPISARSGLEESIELAKKHLKNFQVPAFYRVSKNEYQSSDCQNVLEIHREVKITNDDKIAPAVQVQLGKKVVAVFPEANGYSVQKNKVCLDSYEDNRNFKIIVSTKIDDSRNENVELGNFIFSSTFNQLWERWNDSMGEPIGINTQIYHYID